MKYTPSVPFHPVPDDCTDDADALEHFSRAFHVRYGLTGPILYIGTLDHAIQESLYVSIDDVSLLLLCWID
jgi:hypothetical protein